MHYRSRTRGAWHKGATSGNVQRVVGLALDCDGDAVLARVVPAGPACHTGSTSCFGGAALAADAFGVLDAVLGARAAGAIGSGEASGAPIGETRGAPPETERTAAATAEPYHPAARDIGPAPAPRPSYTQRLLADRNLRLKKLGEEAAELVTACADADPARAVEEGVDLLYHTLVALRSLGVTLDDVRGVVARRHGQP
jgi:phosphoribosyl-ATP pyrophosphohydrolase/phosphoribosyl-AMP cyclohydrolase